MNDPEKPPICEFPKEAGQFYTVDGILEHFEHYFVTDIPEDMERAEQIKRVRSGGPNEGEGGKRRIRTLIPRPPVIE